MHSVRLIPVAKAAAAIALAALVVGCSSGPATGEIHGKVTFKGQPVTEGSVTFLNPKEGGGSEGQIGSDGVYTILGKLVVGEYTVIVSPPMHIVDTDPGKSPPAPVEKSMKNIPTKYRQQGTTPFKFTVKEGKNEINLEMMP